MQTAVGGAFTNDIAPGYLLVSLQWLAALAIFGLVAFYMRTRDHHHRAGDPGSVPQRPGAATVIMTSREDGSLVVRSTTGSVMLCSRLTQAATHLEDTAHACRCSLASRPA